MRRPCASGHLSAEEEIEVLTPILASLPASFPCVHSARQQERITMIRLALEEQVGVDAANPHYGLAGSTTAATLAPAALAPPTSAAPAVNGAQEDEVTGVTSSDARRAEPDADDGMYL